MAEHDLAAGGEEDTSRRIVRGRKPREMAADGFRGGLVGALLFQRAADLPHRQLTALGT
ncbi:hypothetical protein QF026_003217 [Streptomyces aurantiacus]|nr:hypothetical protein [Streptomyces aurantiacus]